MLFVSGLILAFLSILLVVDVMLRICGFTPFEFTSAFTEYALLYITMFAAPNLVRTRGHISIDIINHYISPSYKIILKKVINAMCAIVCFCVSIGAIYLIYAGVVNYEIDMRSVNIPVWVMYLPVFLGFFTMGIEFIQFSSSAHISTSKTHLPDTDIL
jgi:C4-dicarboxylate transporter DctQ subunit